jgi:rSAM/selenodomain-associated transferase 2
MITVIIPIYNEEKILYENSSWFQNLYNNAEVIFVDGGSNDRSIEFAKKSGKVLSSKKGRAFQMNRGVGIASNDILLFLHADSIISIETLKSIETSVRDRDFIGGCLTQTIDKKGFIYRVIEWQGNLRARYSKVFYGDQGIFVRKDIFLKMNGFPEIPIMEDVIFTKRLRKLGRTIILPDRILVSPRRWEQKGIIKTIFLYNLIIILFWLRFPLEKIKHIYKDLR